MASLTLRNIEESLKAKIRMIAAANGRSMEEEVRQILRQYVLRQKSADGVGTRISRRFAGAGGVEMSLPPRSAPRQLKAGDACVDDGC